MSRLSSEPNPAASYLHSPAVTYLSQPWRTVHPRAARHRLRSVIIMNMNEFFRKFAHASAAAVGSPYAFLLGVLIVVVWGDHRPAVRLLGHLAARHQHGHHHRHLPDGVPHPEHPEPRRQGDPPEARRADPRRSSRRATAWSIWRTSPTPTLPKLEDEFKKTPRQGREKVRGAQTRGVSRRLRPCAVSSPGRLPPTPRRRCCRRDRSRRRAGRRTCRA